MKEINKNDYLYYLGTVLATELDVLEAEIKRVKFSIEALKGIADRVEEAFDKKEEQNEED